MKIVHLTFQEFNEFHRCFVQWVQSEPPKWRIFAWIRWRLQKPKL